MAAPFHPARSISFPPRSLPNSIKIDDSLDKLRSFDKLSSSSSIQSGLSGLVELYGYVRDLILSPLTQQALLRWKLAEESMDGSVAVLDTCSSARDLALKFREQVSDLQSALRRKGSASNVEVELRAFMEFRKKMSKEVAKCLRALKMNESKFQLRNGHAIQNEDDDLFMIMVVRVLSDVHGVTVSVFRHLFSFLLAKPKLARTSSSGWSLISRMVTKRSSQSVEKEEMDNEVAGLDLAMARLDVAKIDVKLVREKLQRLDAGIRGLEAGLECVSKCLVENRVSLLNILTH